MLLSFKVWNVAHHCFTLVYVQIMKRVISPYVFQGGGAKNLNYQSLAKVSPVLKTQKVNDPQKKSSQAHTHIYIYISIQLTFDLICSLN